MDASTAARDRWLLLGGAFLRALAAGMAGVLFGLYLARLGLDPAGVASVLAAGFAGACLAGLLVVACGDRVPRRLWLVGLAAAAVLGALAFAAASTPAWLVATAFVGMLSGAGRDRGAALIVEQAALPATTTDERRTSAFAAYNVAQDAGHALGGVLAAWPALVAPATLAAAGLGELGALRASFGVCALLLLGAGALALGLSPRVDAPRGAPAALSGATRRLLLRIGGLFFIDGLGGGLLATALVALFLHERFGAGPAALGLLFAAARVLNALSHFAAAALARRIGLVRTMVFTHLPSSLLLVSVAFAPSFPVAALLFLLREGLVEMDVPTRQSYVMAVVRPEERTQAAGLTHLVRLAAWAAGPLLAAPFAGGHASPLPLLAGAALKIAYDVMLYCACRGVLPPEERRGGPPSAAG